MVCRQPLVGRASPILHHQTHSGLMRVKPGEQRRAEVSEADTLRCQAVQVQGFEFRAVEADVGKSHVVCQDDQDVGALRARPAAWMRVKLKEETAVHRLTQSVIQ